jgi:hypothetical protein
MPPAALKKLTFPNGKPLSPALRAWLAFDASWVRWFDDPKKPSFRPCKLGEWTVAQYGYDCGYGDLDPLFPGDVYSLDFFGGESRCSLYVGDSDSAQEYPVLLTDVDDTPYLCVEFPGIDVYLADAAGLVRPTSDEHGAYASHRLYGGRMKQHAKRWFGRHRGAEIGELLPRLARVRKPQAPATDTRRAKDERLQPETRVAIEKLRKRRKGDIVIAAIELADELQGSVGEEVARAIAVLVGSEATTGSVLWEALRTASDAIHPSKRLHRAKPRDAKK